MLTKFAADFLTVLKARGVVPTVKVLFSELDDLWFDYREGLATRKVFDSQSEQETFPVLAHAQPYKASRAKPLVALLKKLDLPSSYGFVDYGCGRGRVLVLARRFGFQFVTGIELIGELLKDVEINFQRDELGSPELFHMDAGEFVPREKDQVFYFYDPFSDQVLEKCLANIKTSLAQFPRNIVVILHDNLRDPAQVGKQMRFCHEFQVHELYGNRFFVGTVTNF